MRKILIIDDDESLRIIYKRYLTSDGYKVLEGNSGEEALLCFSDQKLDAILLDVRMPHVSGWVVMDSLARCHPKAKIICFSCYPLHIQKKMIPGAAAYYDKSDGYERLSSILKITLEPPMCIR